MSIFLRYVVISLLSDTALLILFFIFPDRKLDLSRYTSKIDQAISKINELLSEHPNCQNLLDRRDLLKTASDIMVGISANMNKYSGSDEKSMSDHAKEMLLKLMKESSLARKTKNSSTNDPVHSDSETEIDRTEFDGSIYSIVIDDYLNGCNEKGSIQKLITKKLANTNERSIRKLAEIYRQLAIDTSKTIDKMFKERILHKG